MGLWQSCILNENIATLKAHMNDYTDFLTKSAVLTERCFVFQRLRVTRPRPPEDQKKAPDTAAVMRNKIIKRAALEFHDGMYGILPYNQWRLQKGFRDSVRPPLAPDYFSFMGTYGENMLLKSLTNRS